MVWIGVILTSLAAAVFSNVVAFALSFRSRLLAGVIGVGVIAILRSSMAQGLPAFIPMTFEVGRRWAVMAACAGAALGVLNGLLATRAGVSSPKLLSQTPSSTPSTDSTMPLNQTGVSLPTMQDFVENVRYRRSTKLICDAATRNRLAFERPLGLAGFADIKAAKVRELARASIDVKQAEQGYLQAFRRWRKMGDVHNAAIACMNLASVYHLKGELTATIQQSELSLELLNQVPRLTKGVSTTAACARLYMGLALAEMGEMARAREVLDHGFRLATSVGDRTTARQVQRAIDSLLPAAGA